MTGQSPFYDLTIHLRVQVIDPAAVMAHPSASFSSIGPDGHLHLYLPGSVEEAVVARFTTMFDQLYSTTAGLRVTEHSEHLAEWDRHRHQ